MQPHDSAALFHHARFATSAGKLSQLPPDVGREVAFAGRSNAGKSSAINAIVGIGGLARTSKTPGRTQLINFFTLGPSRHLVDLPGYGYAKVPLPVKERWQRLLAGYLESRKCLSGVVLVMDIRHPLKPFDQQMLEWCQANRLPVHILLTKADKLSRGAAAKALQAVRRSLGGASPSATVQLFSARQATGVDAARQQLQNWLSGPTGSASE